MSETRPEPMTDVPCRKPTEGLVKKNFTVSGSTTSLRLVVGEDLGHRQLLRLVAETVGVIVFGDRSGIERRAIGEGDARPDLESVFGGIGVDRPALGDPRLDLKRLGISGR